MTSFCAAPSFILNSDDVTERFVFSKRTKDLFEISLMLFKKSQESFEFSDLFPPTVLFHDGKDSSNDVSQVGSTSSVWWKATVLDDNESGSGVIQNYKEFLDWLNSFLDWFDWQINKLRDVLPCFFDVLGFIDIKPWSVWTQLSPDFVIHLNS